MPLILISFLAGVLTVLAPCVLPLIPVIIGSSVTGKNKSKPFLVTAGLILSVTLFTILLKFSTLLINVDQSVWKYFSGGLILLFGINYIIPGLWTKLSSKSNLSAKSDGLLHSFNQKKSAFNSILVGAALGPVFTSCSPTYSLIIATILPVNFAEGLIYIFAYATGLAVVMLLISLLGRQFIERVKVFSDPNGVFKKVLGIIFILVGIVIITGLDKMLQTTLINAGYFDVNLIENQLVK
jgi:cytochrome c-type biogenesis protein